MVNVRVRKDVTQEVKAFADTTLTFAGQWFLTQHGAVETPCLFIELYPQISHVFFLTLDQLRAQGYLLRVVHSLSEECSE